ncbi:MAG: 50S ribosomal protein L21 [Candidatus Atribacteria bacterium]|nr:50S ribosomal protein L21 [Candidatus Atribacteria bacterium]
MYAVIATGGKQYLVKEGDRIKVEKIETQEEGDKVKFDQVLMVEKDGEYRFGQPLIQNSFVEGKILRNGRAKKIIVFTYIPKKKHQRKIGHRQSFTEVEIEKISDSNESVG